MNLLLKIKETLYAVAPIMLIVVILGLTAAPIAGASLTKFLIGGVLIILGLAIFLLGVELGMQPLGEAIGGALTERASRGRAGLALLLSAAFITGFLVTVAEPDVWVLADQLHRFNPDIIQSPLVLTIAVGVGGLVLLGLLRTVLNWSYRAILLIFYGLTFLLAAGTPANFVPVGFDAGGATTGPMTVPFIMALGIGVAGRLSGGKDNSFGLTGIASIGPIMAVLAFGFFAAQPEAPAPAAIAETAGQEAESALTAIIDVAPVADIVETATSLADAFIDLLPEVISKVAVALTPLVVLCLVFQFTLLHVPRRKFREELLGFVYNFIGLLFFFVGVEAGFVPAGEELGVALGGASLGNIPMTALLIFLGALFGAIVVCAEPAVWVLCDQVEKISGGTIRRRVLLVALSLGVAGAVALAVTRVVGEFSLWYYLVPGYVLSLTLTFFAPKNFTAIAFDSGGVASGPMTSTFVLALTLGCSKARGGDPVTDAFGVIAMVALIPLIAIQILGIMYKYKSAAKPQ